MTTHSSNLDHIPGPEGKWLLGNVRHLSKYKLLKSIENWTQKHGPCYKFSIGSRRKVVVVSAPQDVRNLLGERPDKVRRSSTISQVLIEMGIDGVFVAEGEAWKRQRQLVNPTLNLSMIKSMFPKIQSLTIELRKNLRAEGDSVTGSVMQQSLKRYMLDVTSALTMGFDTQFLNEPDNQVARDLQLIFDVAASRSIAPLPYWRYVPSKKNKEIMRATKRTTAFIENMVADTRIAMQRPGWTGPTTFLEIFISQRDAQPDLFTESDIVGNALTMMLAGEDTTAITIVWMLALLSDRPEIVDRIRLELDRELSFDTEAVDYQKLTKLKYLDCVIQETLRLKPAFPLLALETISPIELGEVHVPADTAVLVDLRGGVRDESCFAQPELFYPDRWLEANAADDSNKIQCPHADLALRHNDKQAMYPFGYGVRFCPGRNLAMTMVRTAAVMIITNYDIRQLSSSAPMDEFFNFSLSPTSLPFTLHRRNSN